jgi:aryl-alcohol dehydrogenase-like predicted oxidoreductase
MFDRRRLLLTGSAAVAAVAAGGYWMSASRRRQAAPGMPAVAAQVKDMPYRKFGKTGLSVSEVGFGAWGIGGQSYGAASRTESLAALARAEELGCNFVDTAAVYGDSESVLGEFLAGRRDRWVVSTKYSGQEAGMTATLEAQLRALRTDHVDFYMIHWRPAASDTQLYDELMTLKRSGKARFIGVSLYTQSDIDAVLADERLDGFMVAVSLLNPDPFLACRERIAASGKAVIARSSLREGFLAGKFTRDTVFSDPADQRSKWTRMQIAQVVDQVERFRFLQVRAGSLARAAIGYPLTFPEISSVVLGVKRVSEAEEDFGRTPGFRLTAEEYSRVAELQFDLGVHEPQGLPARLWRRLVSSFGR